MVVGEVIETSSETYHVPILSVELTHLLNIVFILLDNIVYGSF